MDSPELSTESVARLLCDRYESVADVELLKGGIWSTAFRFNSARWPLVVRFGHHVEDYEKDHRTTARALLTEARHWPGLG